MSKRPKRRWGFFYKDTISIDIGSCCIKILVGRFQNNTVFIEKAFVLNTAEDSYADGVILQPERLKKQIFDCLDQNKINTSKVVCTFNSSQLITREIEIPNANPSQIEALIKYEAEKALSIALHEYVLEYNIIEEIDEESCLRVMVSALPKPMVQSYFLFLQQMGLRPVALNIHSHALEKLAALKSLDELNGAETMVFLELGHSVINMNFISNGILQFSRTLMHEGRDIDINSIEHWLKEIVRVFQFYSRNERNKPVKKIFLYGGSARIKGLDRYIQNAIHIETKRIKHLPNIHLNAEAEDFQAECFLNAAGALIR